MDIKEVHKMIDELEKEFSKKLEEFSRETGCYVDTIEPRMLVNYNLGEENPEIIRYNVHITSFL